MSSERPGHTAFATELAGIDSVISAMPVPTLVVDIKASIIAVNAKATQLFGFDRSELLGEHVDVVIPRELAPRHPISTSGLVPVSGEQASEDGLGATGRSRDGRQFPIAVQLQSLDLGCRRVVVVSVEDQRDARVTAELESFAYTASHDLQAPLRSIAGFAELLRTRYENQLDERASRWIDQIVESTSDMQALIHDLLNYSKLESGQLPLEEFSLETLVDGVIRSLEPEIADSGSEVTRDALPVKRVDVPQMRQLVQNLIQNGLKYRGDRPASVHIACEENDGEWILSVRDHGIGIAPDSQEGVFDAFRRLHSEEEFPGSGIGLAVVRKVATRHGGRTWLESRPGEGSTFFVAIPNDPVNGKAQP